MGLRTDWVEEERDGQRLRVWAAPGQSQVQVVRDGTVVTMSTDLDLDSLRAVALSLVPAPTEPPSV